MAGDAAEQAGIWQEVIKDVSAATGGDHNAVLPVKDVAQMYLNRYNELRLRRIESDYLAPLGLSNAQFLAQNRQLAPELVKMLATEAINYPQLGVETLIVGVDDTGAHIYMFANGHLTCEDAVGFAAIGSGAGHANSQFMLARHTQFSPFSVTLMLAYTAKKRAEAAPGVGFDTDMFFIYKPDALLPHLNPTVPVMPQEIDFYEETYRNMADAEAAAFTSAVEKVNTHLDELGQERDEDGKGREPQPDEL